MLRVLADAQFRAIAFIFYFNRALAFLISVFVRTYTWYWFHVNIEIEAIQISPLAGRIFLKGVRYHGHNETISVNSGYITWKYWLRHVRRVNLDRGRHNLPNDNVSSEGLDEGPAGESAPNHRSDDLSPRITVNLRGLEWFVYNRSPAYDAIEAALLKTSVEKNAKENTGEAPWLSYSEKRSKGTGSHDRSNSTDTTVPVRGNPISASSTPSSGGDQSRHEDAQYDLPVLVRLLPIGLKCKKGAMVMGNEHTKSVLVAKFDSANGFIDGSPSGPEDLYKQSFDFELTRFTASFRINRDYRSSLAMARGKARPQDRAREPKKPFLGSYKKSDSKSHVLHGLRRLVLNKKSSLASLDPKEAIETENGAAEAHQASRDTWLGLSRYLDSDEDKSAEQERWESVEYAQVSEIIECPRLGMSFFYDVPGKVSVDQAFMEPASEQKASDINGNSSPDWGLDVHVGGGSINYGPWADRQRAHLQAMFFPQPFAVSVPTPPLREGQVRQSTQFKISIVLDETVNIRIHTREESKDWKWRSYHPRLPRAPRDRARKGGKAKDRDRQDSTMNIRPAGWIDVHVAKDSCVTYIMDMFAGKLGFVNTLSLDVPSLRISTSVNHGLLLRSRKLTMACDLSAPLRWNVQRNWVFDTSWDGLELFFLRDHAFLITDLINDWTSGPPEDYLTFVPFLYSFSLQFSAFSIYLNANDSNIIDSPAAFDTNTYLVLGGENLHASMSIPLLRYRPTKNEITFEAAVTDLHLELRTPSWNTLHSFLKGPKIASLESLATSGSYTYYTSTNPSQTEILILNLRGVAPMVDLYGFLIRYFILFQKNYFGEDMHFQTLEEFQQKLRQSEHNQGGEQDAYPSKISNDLDVILSIEAEEALIVLPSELYSAQNNISTTVAFVGIDLRITNYYMDLDIHSSPLALTNGLIEGRTNTSESSESNTQIFIDSLEVFGHRLFGLPPSEPTYMCNWDFNIGRVTGETSLDFASALAGAGKAFAFQLSETENALPALNATPVFDVTFLRLSLQSMKVCIHVNKAAVMLESHCVELQFNDWAGPKFSENLQLKAPSLEISILETTSGSHHRTKPSLEILTNGMLRTSIDVRMAISTAFLEQQRDLQQTHIELHDSRTQRTPWLLLMDTEAIAARRASRVEVHLPAMPVPKVPEPLQHPAPHERDISLLRPKATQSTSSVWLFEGNAIRHSNQNATKRFSDNGPGTAFTQGTVTFSSPFDTPYFALHSAVPDSRVLPVGLLPRITCEPDADTLDRDAWQSHRDETTRTSLILSLGPETVVFCNPDALKIGNAFLESFHPRSTERLLDEVQMMSVSRVKHESADRQMSSSLEVFLSVPLLAVRFASQNKPSRSPLYLQTHELALSRFRATSRLNTNGQENSSTATNFIAVHVTLQQIKVTARGRNERAVEDQAKLDVRLKSPTFWLAHGAEVASHLHVQGLEITNLNRKVKHLSNLISSSLALFMSLSDVFSTSMISGKRRLQIFVRELLACHSDSPDPTFLTMVPHVLRAAPKHLRSSDTWKLVSRLRHIFNNLSAVEREKIQSICDPLHFPATGPGVDMVTALLNKWRGWDLVRAESNALMQEIYDARSSTTSLAISNIPLNLGVNVESFTVVIDPGPEQNQFQTKQLLTSFTTSVEFREELNGRRLSMRRTAVNLVCDQITAHLNWEICEMLKDIIVQTNAPESGNYAHSVASNETTPEVPVHGSLETLHSLQFILSLETLDLRFQSINLVATILSQSAKASILFDQASANDISLNAVLNARLIASRIVHEIRPLVLIQILDPSLLGSLATENTAQNRRKFWKAGAFCNKIGLEVQEDALGLLGVADLLLRDEATYLIEVQRLMPLKSQPMSNLQSSSHSDEKVQNEFDVTLLLDEYSCTVALISSLRYSIRGSVVRSTITSKPESEAGIQAHFDVKQHHHSLENDSKQSLEVIAGFALPSLNGHVLAKQDDQYRVAISLAMEKISLDASAIYSILTTLNRQELAKFRRALGKDLAIVKDNHRGLMNRWPPKRESRHESNALKVLYSFSIALDGLDIAATTGKSSTQAARLVFELARTSIKFRNHELISQRELMFAELSANVERIELRLERFDGRHGRSCGNVMLTASFLGTSRPNDENIITRCFDVAVTGPEINLFADTAPIIVDILGYLQQKFKNLDISKEISTLRARRHRSKSQAGLLLSNETSQENDPEFTTVLFNSTYSLEIRDVQVSWRVGDLVPISPGHEVEDLVFSIERVNLSAKKMSVARLLLGNLQLQMVAPWRSGKIRSSNSALMPEVVFNAAYLSTLNDRRLAFQAVGKSFDLRLTPDFVLPASDLQRSIGHATEELRSVIAGWNASLFQDDQQDRKLFGNKRLASVLVDADFAGAVVYLQGSGDARTPTSVYSPQQTFHPISPQDNALRSSKDSSYSAVLRTPGIAFKIEYQNRGEVEPSLNAEIKIDASSNTLQPTIVPLILSLTSSIQEIVHEKAESPQKSAAKASPTKLNAADTVSVTDPVAILGDCKLNLGLTISKQRFGLTCQPLAKVAASAEFNGIYVTVNTVQPTDQDRFFALSAKVVRLQASVQHAYSQESTGSFVADIIELSLMNSKHVSNLKGISAILNLGPMKVTVNARQLHDFFIFREIWLPRDASMQDPKPVPSSPDPHPIVMQRYQQAAAASPFPWNATISISQLDVEVDMGSSLGRSAFEISKLWISSTKLSNWEQNLCFGFEAVGINSTGRLSCSVGLQNLRIRTSIKWQETDDISKQTPLIQASLGFQQLHLKAAFEYQLFLVATFSTLDFMMYNVRDRATRYGDRLVCTVEGDQVQAYFTTQTSSQALALYQSIQRLIQEKKQAYENSLKEIQRFYHIESERPLLTGPGLAEAAVVRDQVKDKLPIQLQTNVVVAFKYLNVGAYPRSFIDSNIFKLNALDVSARFSVLGENRRICSSLGMSLGQVRVALSPITRQPGSNTFEEISVDDVVRHSADSRGGTILKVPRVVAVMQTWQEPHSTSIEYIFRSSFEGKVEVGWNINRINVIRSMWNSHSQSLAARLGKALPQSAVQITGVPTLEGGNSDGKDRKEKITAVVNVPLSRYSYTAREPPVIDTPQLRDMGEATPPLEWIGLHRDRLPNITHQIIIVPLLEVAKEVEDAYGRILGAS